jgi:hypothetical protein
VFCHSDSSTQQPSQGDKQGCAHCALCANNSSRNDPPAIAPLLVFIFLRYEDASSSPPYLSDDVQCTTPQGWTSSWSSRAPPSFS